MCLEAGVVPDTVGYGVQVVPKLVLACCWTRPRLSLSWGRVWPAVGRL